MNAVSISVNNASLLKSQVKIYKAVYLSPEYFKVDLEGPNLPRRVYGIDTRYAVTRHGWDRDNIIPENEIVVGISRSFDSLRSSHSWDCESFRKEGIVDFPFYFCLADGQTETDMDVDVEYFAPAQETNKEFHDRMMPFLHESALSFLNQANPNLVLFTENSWDFHAPIHGNNRELHRMRNSLLRGKLPIGYCTRELYKMFQRKTQTPFEDQVALETEIRKVHEILTVDDHWYTHHESHDVTEWYKHLSGRRVVLEDGDDIRVIHDIKAEIRADHEIGTPDEEIKPLVEKMFHQVATRWFTHALYFPEREKVTRRLLTFEKKSTPLS